MIWAGGRMGNANRSASADDSNTRVLPKAETVKGPKPKRVASRSIPARPVTAKAVIIKKDNRERVKSAPAKRVKLIGKSGKDKKSKKTKNDRSKSKPKKEKTRSKSKGRSKSKAKN